MGFHKEKYLKLMLDKWVPNTVATSSWLQSIGISRQLVNKYIKSGWLKPIGRGAFARPNEKVAWQGGLYSLQTQLGLSVHLGGLSSLMYQGQGHYVRFTKERVLIYTDLAINFPKWFTDHEWGQPLKLIKTNMLPSHLALENYIYPPFQLKISSLERAILECLYLSPKDFALTECFEVMEGLITLRPKLMQELLEKCNSIKVKRLFLFMAEKANLPIMADLNLDKIDLGTGTRSLVANGGFNSKYMLTLPKELLNHE